MIAWLVRSSVSHRFVVTLAVIALVVLGVQSYRTLPVDAVPDVTNVQVQVLTSAPGLSPLEVEQLVTRPIELAMTGIPGTQRVRSTSRAAVSAVTIVFDDDVDRQLARQLVSQKLPAAREAVPASAERPEMGPFTTGVGEIYHFTMRWPGHGARDLRTLLDWDIALSLRSVPGVVEVNAWGGQVRQIEVRPRPSDLRALRISEADVERALLEGGQNAGGGAIDRGQEQVLVRLDGQYRTTAAIAAQIVGTSESGLPIYVRDVADVADGVAFRQSVATADGQGETVYAMVQMIAGGNAHDVVRRVKARLAEIRSRLPAGVVLEPFYGRTALVDRVLATVRSSLLEGGTVVVVVLFVLLGDLAASIVVATAIPLAMLGAFAMMRFVGITGNLMSLGAIDFGLVVDGAVVVVEGALAAMATSKERARDALVRQGKEVGGPIAFGIFIIGVVYLPILLLEGVEGKMFRPMAWTVLFAIGTALVLTFTWIPMLSSALLRRSHAREAWVIRQLRRGYRPVLEFLLRRPTIAIALALVMLAIGVAATIGRGAEFIPRLEEGDLVVQVTRPSSVSLAEAARGTGDIERTLKRFPEVRRVVARTGSPDVATDIMGIEMSDVFILLEPTSKWTTAHDREALVGIFDQELRRALPGTSFSFTQPIEMRTQELIGGIRSDVGVKIYGDDLGILRRLGEQVAAHLVAIPGSADVRIEPTEGLPLATVRPNFEKMGRLHVRADEVRTAIEAMRTGRPAGTFVEGERRFGVVVRSSAVPRMEIADLARYPIVLDRGRTVLLGDIADLDIAEGPAQISREQSRRRLLVESNVRGRDLASFVRELEGRLAILAMPTGYYATVSGQYENLARATTRLAIVVPVTLLGVFLLLYSTFHELRAALMIFLNVPVAASGGLVALALRGLPLSISAAVGMIALFGVATLNGVVLLSAIKHHERQGKDAYAAARDAAHERLRPVITTALVASLGFVPMAVATGTGSEVQRPLATVVIGGLVTATLLTLGILPALHARYVAKK